jgi:hypothetical protein
LFVNCNVFVPEISEIVSLSPSDSGGNGSLVEAVVVPAGLFKYLGRFHLDEKSICAIIVLLSDDLLLNMNQNPRLKMR